MPLTHRQIYRRRRIALFGVSVIVVALGLYLPLTLLAPLAPAAQQVVSYSTPSQKAATLSWPGYGASAIGAVGYPNVLAASGNSAPLPMASISKIVTSLVVLDAKPLAVGQSGPTIAFTPTQAALSAKYLALDGTIEPMKAGTSLSQLDFMRVMLVASANNYAEELADWAFGSQTAFVHAATTWLALHGLAHTTVVEPSGINPANVSTASDLVTLGKLALANPVLSSIVSTATLSLPGFDQIHNTNTLLGSDGVQGIKTGTLNNAGSDLLFAATYTIGSRPVTVVGAVLGAADHQSLYASVRLLLADMKAGFHEVVLTRTGQSFAHFSTPWNQTADAVASTRATVVVWSNTPVTAVVSTTSIRLADRSAPAGSVTFRAGTQTVRVPLMLNRSVEDPGPLWRLGNPLALLTNTH